MTFIERSAPDSRRQLRPVEVAVAGSAGQLVEIAFKVSNAREEHRARVVKVFDTARPTPQTGGTEKGAPGRGRRDAKNWRKSRCACCKDEGRWRNQCPKLEKGTRGGGEGGAPRAAQESLRLRGRRQWLMGPWFLAVLAAPVSTVPREPWVQVSPGTSQSVGFLVDTGATFQC